jgi:hypothetical protein
MVFTALPLPLPVASCGSLTYKKLYVRKHRGCKQPSAIPGPPDYVSQCVTDSIISVGGSENGQTFTPLPGIPGGLGAAAW